MITAACPLLNHAPEETFHNCVKLNWDKNKSSKTIYLNPIINVATFLFTLTYERYNTFCQEAEIVNVLDLTFPFCIECDKAKVITDDKDEVEDAESEQVSPHTTSFDLDGPSGNPSQEPAIVKDEEDLQQTNLLAKLLHYHHKLSHISMKQLQIMAHQGVIPCQLAKIPVPMCTACLYGKARRHPWHHKH
jgi:hypothetical protein